MAEHDTRRVAELVAFVIGKTARFATAGSELMLLLDRMADPERARLRIVATGGSPLADAEFAYVAGFASIDPLELEAKPIVMREIARRNHIAFPRDDSRAPA